MRLILVTLIVWFSHSMSDANLLGNFIIRQMHDDGTKRASPDAGMPVKLENSKRASPETGMPEKSKRASPETGMPEKSKRATQDLESNMIPIHTDDGYMVNPPADCIEFQKSCYLFNIKPKTWNSAKHYCERLEGAHLVSIESEEEFDWVVKQITKTVEDNGYYLGQLWGTGKEMWWTAGRRDKEDHDVWVWQKAWGETLPLEDTYVRWDGGEPNDQYGNEDFIVLAKTWGGWGYNDMPKCNELRFACEIELF